MQELILTKTSLPNLHPAMVHFPIALLIVALLLDVIAFFEGSKVWLRYGAILLSVLGALAAGFTYWSGRQAAETIQIPPAAEAALSRHETFALYTLWFFGIYAALRLALQITSYRRWIHALLIVIALFGQLLLLQTADLGGSLVFKHALGVTLPKPKEHPALQTTKQVAGPTVTADEISWKFANGSEKDVAEYFQVHQGSLNDVHLATETSEGRTFLIIHKTNSSPLLLTFKPEYGDIQVETELDASEFSGSVSLVHHVNSNDYDFFTIDSEALQLGRKSGSEKKSFEKKAVPRETGFQKYSAVGSGTHFRGYVNGKLQVHGHNSAAAPGQAGILLEGTGSLKISQISLRRLSEHTHQ